MKTVLYADLLFFINFGMDLISLWLTFLIVHQATSAPRLFCSATLGGIYGVAAVVVSASGLASFALSAAVSVIMIAVAAKGKLPVVKYLKYSFILWGMGALIGGVVSAVCSLGGNSTGTVRAHNAPFFILAASSAICSLIVRVISSFRSIKECDVEIVSFGTTCRVRALVDSGNLVKEPVSGRPVVFLRKGVFFRTAPRDVSLLCSDVSAIETLSSDIRRRTRVLCVDRVGGGSASLCFFPDEVTLIKGKNKKSVKVALCIEDVLDYNGYDAIVPLSAVDL